MFFNTAAFALPAPVVNGQPGPYGNEQFDMLFGPKFVNTDASAFKTFPIYERVNLQFRGEIFNLFNNVNLNNPASNLNTKAQFGKITGAGSPRIVQFALRLSF